MLALGILKKLSRIWSVKTLKLQQGIFQLSPVKSSERVQPPPFGLENYLAFFIQEILKCF